MSKVTYIIKASENTVSENAAKVLVGIAKKDFISPAELRESLSEVSSSAVNSNIGVLLKKQLIEKSGDGLITTPAAQDLLQKAAEIYAAENNPDLLKERKTRSARGTTEDMESDIEFIKEIIEEKELVIKEIEINRSNMGIVLEKRLANGIRKFEVMRNGIFRIFGYKVSQEVLDICKSKGMTYRIATNGNAYIDIKRTQEVMKDIIESL